MSENEFSTESRENAQIIEFDPVILSERLLHLFYVDSWNLELRRNVLGPCFH